MELLYNIVTTWKKEISIVKSELYVYTESLVSKICPEEDSDALLLYTC